MDDRKQTSDNKARRLSRIEKTLREIVGQKLLSMNSLFNGVMVTLVRVRCARDLRSAELFISLFNTEDDDAVEDVFDVLEEKRALLQHQVAKELPMKFCPKLTFTLDGSIDKLVHFSTVLNETKINRDSDSNADENTEEDGDA